MKVDDTLEVVDAAVAPIDIGVELPPRLLAVDMDTAGPHIGFFEGLLVAVQLRDRRTERTTESIPDNCRGDRSERVVQPLVTSRRLDVLYHLVVLGDPHGGP